MLGSAGKVIVAGWPTAIFVASASAKPETISSLSRESSVTKDELEVEPDDAAPPAAPPAEELLDELPPPWLTVEPVPDTVDPTEPLTAVTVPAIGARSVVSLTA